MKHRRGEGDRQRTVGEERSDQMSSIATTPHVRYPVTRSAGVIAAALVGLALAGLIGIAILTLIRDDGPAVQLDPTAAQRIHLVREYGHDPSGMLQMHVLRENQEAPVGTLFDHVLREAGSD
jgi:hypothetical protein